MDYYLLTADGEQAGPYSLDQVRSLWETGRVTLETPYWVSGMAEWGSLRKLEFSLRSSQLALPAPASVPSTQSHDSIVDLVGLSAYYQEEFGKIHVSRESYQGKWNWAAFCFGGLWALVKGLWLSLIVCVVCSFVISSLTCGMGLFPMCVIYAFVYGFRGNYMYYCAYVKHRQIAF